MVESRAESTLPIVRWGGRSLVPTQGEEAEQYPLTLTPPKYFLLSQDGSVHWQRSGPLRQKEVHRQPEHVKFP